MINNGALQDSEISAYMEKQLSDSDVSALIKKVQNELDQAQQSDPSLEEFLNGLGEEAGVSTEAEDGLLLRRNVMYAQKPAQMLISLA